MTVEDLEEPYHQYHHHPVYVKEYGSERWVNLLYFLAKPTNHCRLINQFSSKNGKTVASIEGEHQWDAVSVESYIGLDRYPTPSRTENGLFNYYLLDAASLLPVELLLNKKKMKGRESLKILDLCAAPGGKSLTILQHCFKFMSSSVSSSISLVCNEINFDRRKRLRRVLDDYIPKSLLVEGEEEEMESPLSVKVTGFDATDARIYSPQSYDRILIDAPCSSERHHIQQGSPLPSTLSSSSSSSSSLVKMQQTMLLNGLHWLKPGGKLVYATCSLNPAENDGVIDHAIEVSRKQQESGKRDLGTFKVIRPKLNGDIGEKTKWGWLVLPDNNADNVEGMGFGPLYFCTLVKEEEE